MPLSSRHNRTCKLRRVNNENFSQAAKSATMNSVLLCRTSSLIDGEFIHQFLSGNLSPKALAGRKYVFDEARTMREHSQISEPLCCLNNKSSSFIISLMHFCLGTRKVCVFAAFPMRNARDSCWKWKCLQDPSKS